MSIDRELNRSRISPISVASTILDEQGRSHGSTDCGRLELHSLQCVHGGRVSSAQSLNACYSPVNYSSQFGSILMLAVLAQTRLRFFRDEPGPVSIEFLWRAKPQHFTKKSMDNYLARLILPAAILTIALLWQRELFYP